MTRRNRRSERGAPGVVPIAGASPEDLAQLAPHRIRSRADIVALMRNPRASTTAKATACAVLGRQGGTGVCELLTQQFRTARRPIVYWEAAKALGLLHDRKAIGPLGRLVNGRLEPRRRAAAAYALGLMGHRAAASALLKAIQAPDAPPIVREHAVEALGLLEVAAARNTIVRLLEEDRSPGVRGAAAYALGRIGTADTLKVLERAAETDSGIVPYLGPVRAIARASMREIRRSLKRR